MIKNTKKNTTCNILLFDNLETFLLHVEGIQVYVISAIYFIVFVSLVGVLVVAGLLPRGHTLDFK